MTWHDMMYNTGHHVIQIWLSYRRTLSTTALLKSTAAQPLHLISHPSPPFISLCRHVWRHERNQRSHGSLICSTWRSRRGKNRIDLWIAVSCCDISIILPGRVLSLVNLLDYYLRYKLPLHFHLSTPPSMHTHTTPILMYRTTLKQS